jgi:hypothetical protein
MLIEKVAPKGGDTRDGKLRTLILHSDNPDEQESLARLAEGLQRGLRITIHDEDEASEGEK